MTAPIKLFTGEHRFLSNFYPSLVIDADGSPFRTVEHAYQAAKTNQSGERKAIALASTPGKAKRLGMKVQLRPDWERIKVDVMRFFIMQKFLPTHHNDLARMLLNTGESELIEGNNWGDTFWGVCDGVGHNMLGKILMEMRSKL